MPSEVPPYLLKRKVETVHRIEFLARQDQ